VVLSEAALEALSRRASGEGASTEDAGAGEEA
jgi:hypothetical protein